MLRTLWDSPIFLPFYFANDTSQTILNFSFYPWASGLRSTSFRRYGESSASADVI